jgi:hypothetical protein
MSSTTGLPTGADGDLRLTVPAGWSIVNLDLLLDESFATAIADRLDAQRAAAVEGGFKELRDSVDRERLLLMAIRLKDGGAEHDVMTVACVERADSHVERSDSPMVRAIVTHSTRPEPVLSTSVWPSRVQAQIYSEQQSRSPVVTLLSSKAGTERELEDEASTIGRSMFRLPPQTTRSDEPR